MTILVVFWVGVCDTDCVMKNNLPNTLETFETIMAEYRDLTPTFKMMVRKAAVVDMQESGMYDEIGSSDVNHHIFGLYRQLGSFEKIIINAVDLMR